MNNVFIGKLVRLSAYDPEEMSKAFARWNRNSEYQRLLFGSPRGTPSTKAELKWMEEEVGEMSPASYFFTMRTLSDNALIGELSLDVVNWGARDAFVAIGIGEPENWGKGYGTDAMNILLRFAFSEINLHRVTLSVFEYNPRAIRSYEKLGFHHEGCKRLALDREGRRWDELFMGILREEWLSLRHAEA